MEQCKDLLCPVPLSRRHAGTGHLPTNPAAPGKETGGGAPTGAFPACPGQAFQRRVCEFPLGQCQLSPGDGQQRKAPTILSLLFRSKGAPRNPAAGGGLPGCPGPFGLFPHLGSHARAASPRLTGPTGRHPRRRQPAVSVRGQVCPPGPWPFASLGTHYHTAGEGPQGICLVTGEWGPHRKAFTRLSNM